MASHPNSDLGELVVVAMSLKRHLWEDFITGSAVLMGLIGVLLIVGTLITGDSPIWGRFGAVIGFNPVFMCSLRLRKVFSKR